MSLRRAGTIVLALALAACQSVTQEPKPASLVIATFSSATAEIPTPNDLALNATLPSSPSYRAQKALLAIWGSAGGFPDDQEVPVTIPVQSQTLGAAGYTRDAAGPTIDLATAISGKTVAVYRVDVSPVQLVDVDVETSPGSITLRKKPDATGSRRWASGARYVAGVRGGASGLKRVDGVALGADQAIQLVAPNLDLRIHANQPPGGIPEAELAQLENLRALLWNAVPWCYMPMIPPGVPLTVGWNPVTQPSVAALCAPHASLPNGTVAIPTESAFQAISHAFPPAEVASLTTFGIAAASGTAVAVDPGSGLAPLPIDLMRDPIPGNDTASDAGLVLPNPAFGAFSSGLATLDGFSTTAMVFAPTVGNAVVGSNVLATGGAILAGTVAGNVMLYKGTNPVVVAGAVPGTNEIKYTWTQVLAIGTQPSAIQAPCSSAGPTPTCSRLIGLQPAAGVGKPQPPPVPNNLASLPPLEENTKYALVVTRNVLDAGGRPLVRSTVAKILLEIPQTDLLAAMIPDASAPADMSKWTPVSLLAGIDATTAWGLQKMRGEVFDLFGKAGIAPANVAMAYTFKTQTNKAISSDLAGVPYLVDQTAYALTNTVVITPVAVGNVAAPPGVPLTGVLAFKDVSFNSIDAIDKSTGALNPDLEAQLSSSVTTLHALVAIPDPANPAIADCPGGYPIGSKCPRLVIFGHGLNGSKETLFTNAATLASAGFVAAAIDFPLHGGRNWCGADADCQNADGSPGAAGSCNKGADPSRPGNPVFDFTNSAGQGDAVRPGVCASGTTPRVFSAPGVNVPSRYFVSSNFFRIRDAFRQNVLDVSALTLALNRPPVGFPQPAANPFVQALGLLGMFIDPATTYYEGLSLGGISGTSAVAANPRISRAVLSVPGGTEVDVFVNSPAFHDAMGALLASIIPGFTWEAIDSSNPAFDPAIAAEYLQVINVAKWILDPGDGVNYANSLTHAGAGMPDFLLGGIQAPKQVHGQVAALDQVIPNTQNWLLLELIGGSTTLYTSTSGTNGAVSHGMLATIAQVQADAAAFLVTGVPTAATVTLP